MPRGRASFRDLKGAFFQAFVEDDEAIPIPNQEFDVRAATVDKYEHVARERIAFHCGRHQSTQAVKTLSHVGGLAVKEVALSRRKRDHTESR